MSISGQTSIGRRGLIRGLCFAGSSLIAARWIGAMPAKGGPLVPQGAERWALSRGVRVIGEHYLAVHPQEASRERLRALLPADPGDLARRVRRDFAADDLVSVRGWLLARTECRACALAVLTT